MTMHIIEEGGFDAIQVLSGCVAYVKQDGNQIALDEVQAAKLADILAAWALKAKGKSQ